MDQIEECTLLGASLLGAQKLEFALYGIVSHLAHAYDGKKDKRFTELTPEEFFRGTVDDLKLTLGQLENAFGDKLLIRNDDLVEFIKNRNLIAHNYWRMSKTNIKGGEILANPKQFLCEFIKDCDYWQAVVNGFLWLIQKEAAKKENRLDEITFSDLQNEEIKKYYSHVQKNT